MMLDELLGVKPTGIYKINVLFNHYYNLSLNLIILYNIAFLPSIPHLVYQYNLYTNYNSDVYSKKNPEIPE